MKRFFLAIPFIFSIFLVSGQGFNQAVGIRGGITSGFEYRYYVSDTQSFKGLLGTRDGGVQLHGFAEFYKYDLFSFSYQLVFYYGLGGHLGYERWDEMRYQNNSRVEDARTSFLGGIDGVMGVEYLFYEVPFSAGLEIKPYFDVFGRRGFDIQLYDVAFTVKYLF